MDKKSVPLNSFLANAGVSSRRMAVDLIKKGYVTVNDELITEPGYKLLPTDVVKYKHAIIKPEKKIYVLLNKPRGYVTTLSDERGRRTVMDLVRIRTNERLFPVGRLDRDTTGLLLITNDGLLAQKLAHPRYKVAKRYYVVLNFPFKSEDFQKLKRGVMLEDGRAYVDKIFYAPKGKTHVIVEIHIGKKRVVKRMFDALGYKVVGLDRINYANLTKKGLLVGNWRYLTDKEVEELRPK